MHAKRLLRYLLAPVARAREAQETLDLFAAIETHIDPKVLCSHHLNSRVYLAVSITLAFVVDNAPFCYLFLDRPELTRYCQKR